MCRPPWSTMANGLKFTRDQFSLSGSTQFWQLTRLPRLLYKRANAKKNSSFLFSHLKPEPELRHFKNTRHRQNPFPSILLRPFRPQRLTLSSKLNQSKAQFRTVFCLTSKATSISPVATLRFTLRGTPEVLLASFSILAGQTTPQCARDREPTDDGCMGVTHDYFCNISSCPLSTSA